MAANHILRWGLLGTARINRAVIPVIRESSRSTLEAVASRTIDRAREYASEWNIPRAIGSYEALLDDSTIDAIYIAIPNSLHAEWTIRALDAGKHVLCEKPLALSVEQVDEIARSARRAGRVAAEAFMYRHHPLTHAVQKMILDGTIGQLRLIRGAFTFPLTHPADVRFDPALGGGSLWDVGCYPVSYACLLAGDGPSDVFGWQEKSESGIDIAFSGMLRFPGGVMAQFDCGFRAAFRAEMEIVGTTGVLRVDRAFKAGADSRLLLTNGDVTETLRFDHEGPYVGEIQDMTAAALDGRAPRVTLAESRRTVEALTRLYASAAA
ncbi:MAG: gfo/Idh/MocA family oxidoreductase [Acidobacteria bacterium]|nr:MAG: gfo/Idh/MocA family oxidoreductase [Acidobacteriota bacterium]